MSKSGPTYYWDYDRLGLLANPDTWTEWLRERFEHHVLFGLREIVKAMQRRREIGWVLIYGHSLFGAVEALSSFAFRNRFDRDDFIAFCDEYFLPKPPPWPDLSKVLYENFRCGLAHGFGIEKGGITFKEDMKSIESYTKKD